MIKLCGRTHLIIGATSALVLINPKVNDLSVTFSFAVIGSLLPDIDIKSSPVRKPITIFSVFIIFYYLLVLNNYSFTLQSIIGLAIMLGFSIYIILLSSHRTITHSIMGFLVYLAAVGLSYPNGTEPFLAGYLSHLAADSITKSGIPLFYPIDTTKYGFKFIKTGGAVEHLILLAFFILLGFIIIKKYIPFFDITL